MIISMIVMGDGSDVIGYDIRRSDLSNAPLHKKQDTLHQSTEHRAQSNRLTHRQSSRTFPILGLHYLITTKLDSVGKGFNVSLTEVGTLDLGQERKDCGTCKRNCKRKCKRKRCIKTLGKRIDLG